jgi:DNA mismatch repair protein MutL
MQWQNKYIIVPTTQGLMMVHPHRAHTAILYKELLAQLSQHKGASQQLLFPEVIDLSTEDLHTLQALQDDLSSIGFGLDQFSPNAYTITAVPMQLGQVNPCETLLQVIHQVQDTGSTATQQWHEAMAFALADKMAIPMGKMLHDAEMRDLLKRLNENHPAQYLSNGQTIFTILTPDEIQKRF